MSGDKMGVINASRRVEGFYAEGGNLDLKKIVKAGTNENQVAACSAAADKPAGVIVEAGYESGTVGVVTKGHAPATAGGVAAVGDMAILSSTGQKVLSVEQSPNTTDDEVTVLGKFASSSAADGDEVIIDVDIQTIKNPKVTQVETIIIGSVEAQDVQYQQDNLGTVAATYAADIFEADAALKIVSFEIAVSTTVAADGTNYWEANLINQSNDGSGTNDILDNSSDVNTTKAVGFTGDVMRTFALNSSYATLAAGDVLQLVLTKAASAADLVGVFVKIGVITASGEYAIFKAPLDLLITGIEIINSNAVSTSDTNYYTFNATNKADDGSGTDEVLLTTGSANTTKVTGGSALSAFVYRSLGLHATTANKQLDEDEVLSFSIAKTGNPTDLTGFGIRISYTKR